MLTTTIGAYPKPAYLKINDWFGVADSTDTANPTRDYLKDLSMLGEEKFEALATRATREAVETQIACGIDICTDGEMRRENYIHYHCRHIDGIDFSTLTPKEMRGNYQAFLPTVTSKIKAGSSFLHKDYAIAQAFSDAQIKITLPGPLTIMDSIANTYYDDEEEYCHALACALNTEALSLAAAGCKHIQIDEPVSARKPDKFLKYGIKYLDACFDALNHNVEKSVHACCGYPNKIDADYPKAPKESYLKIADAIEASSIDALSIEDAHRHNPPELFDIFKRTKIILGLVKIASSTIESTDGIARRIETVAKHIPIHRLIASPDCGLGLLDIDTIKKKLTHLSAAAKRFD